MRLEQNKELTFENLNIKTIKLALIISRFNPEITTALKQGAVNRFLKEGGEIEQIDCFEVPGAFEIPLVAKRAAQSKKYDAIICLGAVIKGDTAHFEYISETSIRGLSEVSLQVEIPVLCGILTTYTLEQTQARSCEKLNIGQECLISALSMIQTLRAFS